MFLGGNGNLVLQVPTPEFVFSWAREFVPIVSGPEEIPSLPLADWHAAPGQHEVLVLFRVIYSLNRRAVVKLGKDVFSPGLFHC